LILAIDIGGTQFRLAAVEPSGKLVKVVRKKTEADGGADWMVDQVLSAAGDLRGRFDIASIGIGFGGPVDFAGQRVINSTHVAGWDDVLLPEIISKELGIQAIVDNDANVGALGEFTFGAGKGLNSIVYYTVSTGIGGGIILNGEVFRGANGNAGELGHVPILVDGPWCACGNSGCLESLCSGPAIAARAAREIPELAGQTGAKSVFDLARTGNRKAARIVGETAEYLGMGISATINTLAPEMVVVGGGVSKAGRLLFDPLRRCVERRVMPVHRPSVRVVRAKRGDHAVLLGAAVLALGL
jgi:glucokinase